MGNPVIFTATKLEKTGKKGVLPVDENGYYTMAIGGLNAFNSVGEYYTLEGARQLFQNSSLFMKRVQNGALKAEVGHPQKEAKQSMDDYIGRILRIDEANVCAHFASIWLDESYGKKYPEYKNPGLCAIMAKVKPAGPKGEFLKESFEDPLQNVAFSIRALTRDYWQRGQKYRVLDNIITFDYVNMPGIAHANKWSAPALESSDLARADRQVLERIVNDRSLVATEQSSQLAIEALKSFDKPLSLIKDTPIYKSW